MRESLIEMPTNMWPEIKSVLKLDFPSSIIVFGFLESMEEFERRGGGFNAKVYCPLGDVSKGLLAINFKNNMNEVIIHCPKDDTRELEESLKQTKVIDWSKVKLPFLQTHVKKCILNAITGKDVHIYKTIPSITNIKYIDDPQFDISIPNDCSMQPLSLKYVDVVNSNWPHKYPGSEEYIELLIKNNLGYGLFKDNELLSSLFIRESGDLAILYTNEKHRNKGYAKLIFKLLCNSCQKKGKHIFISTVLDNIPAVNFYRKLNFSVTFEDEWCYLGRKH